MTNQARHNQVVKNDVEANNRYESANSWWSCFIGRIRTRESGFFMPKIQARVLHVGWVERSHPYISVFYKGFF